MSEVRECATEGWLFQQKAVQAANSKCKCPEVGNSFLDSITAGKPESLQQNVGKDDHRRGQKVGKNRLNGALRLW